MSFYKILEEIPEIKRFQLVQRSYKKLELRLIADDKKIAFNKATKSLQEILNSKSIYDVELILSENSPQTNKASGKFNHIYKDFK